MEKCSISDTFSDNGQETPFWKVIFGLYFGGKCTVDSSHAEHILKEAYEKGMQFSLFEQAPVGIGVYRGPQLIVEMANPIILRYWGRTLEEVIGKPLFEALPEARGQGYEEIIQGVYLSGIPFTSPEIPVILNRTGEPETLYTQLSFTPLRDKNGKISGIMGLAYDITDMVVSRKKVEENEQKWKDAEERLRLAAEGTGLATWDLNLSTDGIVHSSQLALIFGYRENRVLTHATMLAHVLPEDLPVIKAAFDKALRDGHYYYEARVHRNDGLIHWARVHGRILFDDLGVPQRMLGTARDVTIEKTSAVTLHNLKVELEQRVATRTQELQVSNEELRRVNRDLEQFAYAASHDLQEPLRKIRTFISLCRKGFEGSAAIGYLNKIDSSAERMAALIRDILDYARLSRRDDLRTKVDLTKIVENVLTDFELLIRDKEASVNYSGLSWVQGIPKQLEQLFANLISNALKFSAGSPEINITGGMASPVDIAALQLSPTHSSYACITVADNGIGFDQQYAGNVFTIFQRLHNRDAFEGTGIGLAICKKIVENHEGAITVKSQSEVGTTFTIYLPC
jgi:PAS domain S-box-containing protein